MNHLDWIVAQRKQSIYNEPRAATDKILLALFKKGDVTGFLGW